MPAIALGIVSAFYFALTIGLAIDWNDEGQIVYLSWRVSQGAVPYRDFHHIYGPSLFLLNGSLFHLFGADLLVLRVVMVLLKAGIVSLSFVLARRVAAAPVAAGAALLLILIWGAPWFFFSTPYASYFAIFAGLAGVALLPGRGGSTPALLAAGLCFGVAATFKQTTGAFFFLAAAAALMTSREPVAAAGEATPPRAGWDFALRGGFLLLALAFAAAILLRTGHGLDALILGAASLIVLAALLLRELRDPPPRGAGWRSARRVLVLTGGAALPLLGCAAFFARHGALGALLADTILELPGAIDFLVRPDPFHLAAALWAVAVLSVSVALRRRAAGGAATPALTIAGGAGLLALGLAIYFAAAETAPPWWRGVVFGGFALMPIAVAASAIAVLREGARSTATTEGEEALRRVALLAALGLLNLVPVADIWHILLALPVFLPVLAAATERALPRAQAASGRSRALALLFLAAFVLAPVAIRFVDLRPISAAHRAVDIDRATGLRLHQRWDRDALELVAFLRSEAQRDRPVFVLTGQHMLYFLADRVSPVDEAEFALYLIGFDLMAAEDLRRRVAAEKVVDALRASDAIIVEEQARGAPGRVRATLPALGDYVDRSYRETRRFGRFRVLEPAAP